MHRGILPDTNGKNDEEPDLLTPRPRGTRDHVFSQLIFSVTRNFTRRMRHDQDGAFDAWQWLRESCRDCRNRCREKLFMPDKRYSRPYRCNVS